MSWVCLLQESIVDGIRTPIIIDADKIVAYQRYDDEIDPLLQPSGAVTMVKLEGGLVVRVSGTVEDVAPMIERKKVATIEEAVNAYCELLMRLRKQLGVTEEG